MKIIISLAIILFPYSICYSQNVYKYKAFESECVKNSDLLTSDKWGKTDLLVVINMDKNKVNIYSKIERDLDLLNLKKPIKTKDGDTQIHSEAVDENGIKCDFALILYKDNGEHTATLLIQYSDYTFAYKLMND